MSEQRTRERLEAELHAAEREIAHLRVVTAAQADRLAAGRSFRVKLRVPCGDCHYFYASSLDEAVQIKRDLLGALTGVEAVVWVYVETAHGHVRVDDGRD